MYTLSIGLVVSAVILQQGFGLLAGAWGDLTDAGVSPRTQQSLKKIIAPLMDKSGPNQIVDDHDGTPLPLIVSIQHLRARHAGSLLFVDLVAEVPGHITISQSSALEKEIERLMKTARREVAEVRVTFRPINQIKEI